MTQFGGLPIRIRTRDISLSTRNTLSIQLQGCVFSVVIHVNYWRNSNTPDCSCKWLVVINTCKCRDLTDPIISNE